MSVTTFRSTDSGAPVLSGTSGGGLCALFDTCLVGSGTAYGSLPKKGWTIEYTGTDKRVYRTVDGVAYLRVMHDGSQGAASYREAVVRAAEGATDVDTLVDPYPLAATVADSACVWRTSATADSTARPWILVADENWFILTVEYNSTSGADVYIFGKYSATRSANSWAYVVNTRSSANSNADHLAGNVCAGIVTNFAGAKLFAMRTTDGVIKAPHAALITESASGSGAPNNSPGRNGTKMPDADGTILHSPPQIWINDGSGGTVSGPRPSGFFPNLWSPMHDSNAAGSSVAYGDVFNAAGYDPSAQFAVLGGRSGAAGKWNIEITDTWQDPLA